MRASFLVLLGLPFAVATACAGQLTLLTEEDPPYSQRGTDGKPTGLGVDIVNSIQQRLGGNVYPIRIWPWTRVYRTAMYNPDVVAFAMSRTREREPFFQWVGPIITNEWVIIAPKASHLQLSSLDEAKKLKAIGSVRGYAWTDFLLKQGFENLDLVSERKINPRKALARHIDAFVSADCSWASEVRAVGLNPDDFEISMKFASMQMYIAFSRGSDSNQVAAWQSALNGMKADGSYATLLNKWIPRKLCPERRGQEHLAPLRH